MMTDIFLTMRNNNKEVYYDTNIDFYLPNTSEIVLVRACPDFRRIFKQIIDIEEFLFTHKITQVTVISLNKMGHIEHPLSKITIISLNVWKETVTNNKT